MRETCARVLAAALMTGAIATALGLPAAFDSALEPGHGLTAPPSSLQHTVHVPAVTAWERPPRAERLVAALSIRSSAARPLGRHVTSRETPSVTQSNPPPAKGPSVPPASEPETRELASATPQAAQPAPAPSRAAPAKAKKDTGKKGKSHGKGKAKAVSAPAPSAGQATPAPAAEPQGEAEGQHEHEHGQGHEKEKGHAQKD
jgi:hypothetical protein